MNMYSVWYVILLRSVCVAETVSYWKLRKNLMNSRHVGQFVVLLRTCRTVITGASVIMYFTCCIAFVLFRKPKIDDLYMSAAFSSLSSGVEASVATGDSSASPSTVLRVADLLRGVGT